MAQAVKKESYDLSRYESSRRYRAGLSQGAPAKSPAVPAPKAQKDPKLISIEKAKKDQEKRTAIKRFFFSAVAAGMMMMLIICNSTLNELTAENGKLKNELSDAESENTRITLEIEQGTNLTDVENYAKNNLGMSKLDRSQTQYITLDENDKVVVMDDKDKNGLIDKIMSLFDK